ncbi:MAG: hypothetical protein LIP77_07550 [Planctomycetes bacterium]|nr:hypothetical protein [Planctomycetota bacterium]
MARIVPPSRWQPAFLLHRHGGVVFLLVSLGLAAGTAWRSLAQPTRYQAEARAIATASGTDVDWREKEREWQLLFADADGAGLFANNLRYLYKTALTLGRPADPGAVSADLAALAAGRSFSLPLYRNAAMARLGPAMPIAAADLAANLDFQSLAAIVGDLDPPAGAAGWDFAAYRHGGIGDLEDDMVIHPGRDDRAFRVLFHLHDLLHPDAPAASPREAWHTAVATLSDRIQREIQFAGGGGFGQTAATELVREIAALPALVASGLYAVNPWSPGTAGDGLAAEPGRQRWDDRLVLTVTPEGDAARVTAAATLDLYPLVFPRETPVTRLSSLEAVTMLLHLAAKENRQAAIPPPTEEEIRAAADPAPPPTDAAAADPEPAPPPRARPESTERREEYIRLEEERGRLVFDRDARRRRLEAARENDARLAREAEAARRRADRLEERYAAACREETPVPTVPPEAAKLLAERDAVVDRLAGLLVTCTEEHPFVKEARRELAGLDARLTRCDETEAEAAGAEAEALRRAELLLEWEAATAAADVLEERSRRSAAAVACLFAELETAEEAVAAATVAANRLYEALSLADAKRPPEPVRRPTTAPAEPVRRPALPRPAAAAITFTLADRVTEERLPPSFLAPLLGLIAGGALGLAAAAAREAGGARFATVAAARRLLPYPVLAALPAYDVKSLRVAAAAMKGEVVTGMGRVCFAPALVELFEPVAVGRRERLRPARRLPLSAPWIAGVALLLLSALMTWAAAARGDRPVAGYADGLRLPDAVVGAREP